MNPRSPPARPHIGIHSSFASTADWAEDDAWDSTSDSESPRQSSIVNRTSAPPSTATPIASAPRPVPSKVSSDSSSSLAFSYTHLAVPGSYPPRPELVDPPAPKNGWTIVRTSPNHHTGDDLDEQTSTGGPESTDVDGDSADIDVEGDMILGDLDPDTNPADTAHPQASPSSASTSASGGIPPSSSYAKNRKPTNTVRPDADAIVNGD